MIFLLNNSIDDLKVVCSVMELFLKKQDKCKFGKGPRVLFFVARGDYQVVVYELSVKTLMCF